MVGTVRMNSRGLPEVKNESLKLHETRFYYGQHDTIQALKHQGKKNNSVKWTTVWRDG